MAFAIADRVFEQVFFTGGTGPVTLTVTPVAKHQSFLAGWGASGSGWYCLTGGTVQWETGLGTLNAGGTVLTRTTVFNGSSGPGVPVPFSAGAMDCFGDLPAARIVAFNESLGVSIPGTAVSSSPTTGAVIVAGGLGVNGNIFCGGGVSAGNLGISTIGPVGFSNTTASTSSITGALTVAGGVGIANNLSIGSGVIASGNYVINVAYSGNVSYGMGMRQAVDGAGQAIAFVNAAGSTVGSITSTASVTAYNTSSDGRLKEDLRSNFDAGNIIDALQVYDFAWRGTGERSYGVVAQEAAEIYPQAVTHGRDDSWGADYSKFVPLLLQEIKSLRARVDLLEAVAGRSDVRV